MIIKCQALIVIPREFLQYKLVEKTPSGCLVTGYRPKKTEKKVRHSSNPTILCLNLHRITRSNDSQCTVLTVLFLGTLIIFETATGVLAHGNIAYLGQNHTPNFIAYN